MTEQPLLNYQPSTSPSPLQSGTRDTPGHARIVISVTPRDHQSVYCEQIQIAVPRESVDGAPYFTGKPTCSVTPEDKWNVPVSAASVQEAEAAGDSAKDPYQFTITNKATDDDDDTDLVDYPMTIVLTGPLGPPTGTLTCQIGEKSTTDNEMRHKLRGPSTVAVPVEAPPFYLRNFITRNPSRITVPQTRFAAGDAVAFTWESNGTSFTLYDGDGTVLYKGTNTHVILPDDASDAGRGFALANDTTFTLVAEYTAHGFQPIYLNALVPVTVTDPTIAALTINGPLTARGDLSISSGGTEKLTTSGTNGLIVQGDLRVNQSATVYRQLTAAAGISGGQSGVSPLSVLNGLWVEGHTTLHAQCTVTGLLRAEDDLFLLGELTAAGQSVVRYHDEVAITGGYDGKRLYAFEVGPDVGGNSRHVYVVPRDLETPLTKWKIEPRS